MARRVSRGRTFRKGTGDLDERLDRLEARIERLERATGPAPERAGGERSCCEDIIGCLDDCVTDVRELRTKVRDARS